jgi:hypothetical protein
LHGASQDDDLARDAGQRAGRLGHRVGAVCDQDAIARAGQHPLADKATVGFGDVEAVLRENRLHGDFEGDVCFPQHFRDGRRPDLELALSVEVNLVDRAACGQDVNLHCDAQFRSNEVPSSIRPGAGAPSS